MMEIPINVRTINKKRFTKYEPNVYSARPWSCRAKKMP